MADNYLQFSAKWAVSPAEAAWIETALTNPPADWFEETLADTGEDSFADMLGFDWKISGAAPCELWVWAEEFGNPDTLCVFLQAFLRAFRPDESLGFTYAETCSKMRTDQFSGGACVVTAEEITSINAQDWMKYQLHEVVQQSQAKAVVAANTSIRLIISFDITATTPTDAYAVLAEQIGNVDLAWETSDEWYGTDGEAGSPAELQAAIMQHLNRSR